MVKITIEHQGKKKEIETELYHLYVLNGNRLMSFLRTTSTYMGYVAAEAMNDFNEHRKEVNNNA